MIAPPSTAKANKASAKLFIYYNSLNKVTLLCKVSDLCVLLNLKKIQITYDLLRFISHVHDDVCDDMCGLLIFLYRIVDIMISVTKQMEAAEANVWRGGLQNDNALQNFESFTGQWRLLSAWRTKAAFITKNWVALHSWNDLRISFKETGTAVHMIFRQN